MIVWIYKIITDMGPIITKDAAYAEKRSKLGNTVFCKRETNIYRFHQ